MSPFLEDAIATFRGQKRLAERAMEQVSDEQLHTALSPYTNNIAVIVKHLSGNMLSRWTDFLTSDGEKPWRDRDDEFVDTLASREEVIAAWEKGWQRLFLTLESLNDADLLRTVTVRGEPQRASRAILRQMDHYGYHVGQIVMIARILAGEKWEYLTVPPGGSRQYNEEVRRRLPKDR